MRYQYVKSKLILAVMLIISSCYYSDDITREPICSGTNLSVSATPTATSGCGQSDGSISADATGGSGSYQFSLDGGVNINSSGNFSELEGGTYMVIVYDGSLCTDTTEVIVNISNSSFAASVKLKSPDTDCFSDNGNVELQASGTTGAVTYELGTSTNSTGLFSGLAPGSYSATVSDQVCSSVVEFLITSESSVSYATDVVPFLTTYCNDSGCHGNNSPRANLTLYDGVKGVATSIKSRISGSNPSMPKDPKPGGTPSANEIAKIICWVDDGAKDN